MQIQNGFIKVHRNIRHCSWYNDAVVRGVFLHLLLITAYKDTEWMGITVKRGQTVVGLRKLGTELGYTYQQIRTALDKLEAAGEITTVGRSKYTVITILKWEKYQSYSEVKSAAEKDCGSAEVFVPPSADEVRAYCIERGNNIDPERFVDYYTARGWSIGKYKMSEWRAAVRAWEKNEREKPAPKNKFNNFEQKKIDYDAVKQKSLNRLLEKWG